MTKVSNILLTKLKEINADVESSLLVMIGLQLNLNFEKIYSESVTMQKTINTLLSHRIIDVDYGDNTIVFNYQVFGEAEETDWKWVIDEYIPLFTDVRKDAGGNQTSVTNRMKRFFIDNPGTKKQDVLEAVKLYLKSDECSDVKYLQQADYFIKKGIGVNSTSRLSKYLSLVQQGQKDNSSFQMM